MDKVMLTLHGCGADVTLEDVMQELQLRADEVDMEYGVQLIDPAMGDLVILVEESAARRIDQDQAAVSGPYSNPVVETFGATES